MEILVVDDKLAIRKGLAALLEESGYSVRTARDGIAAPDDLTKTEADIYRLLASEKGRYFSAREIFSAIRGEGYSGDEGNLRSHMSRLRGKLPTGMAIAAIRGRGYALTSV